MDQKRLSLIEELDMPENGFGSSKGDCCCDDVLRLMFSCSGSADFGNIAD